MKPSPVPVIDAHVHLYPDALAPRVVPALSARFGNAPCFDGTLAGCRASDAAAGVSLAVNLPVATSPEHVTNTNAFWRTYARPKDGILSLAALHPRMTGLENELDRIVAAGFAGVKLHPEYQDFHPADTEWDTLWAALAERDLVAFLHAGGERVFQPPFHSSPREFAAIHRRFPKLRLVCAHLGGFNMWQETEETLLGEDLWLDLSHTFFWMPHDRILRMIRRHGAHRILFGTDAPWQAPAEVLAAFHALPLREDEKRRILCGNAETLFGIATSE